MMTAAVGGDPNSAPPSGGGGGMNLPSLRIEGCTPPSESSLEGEEQLYKCEWDAIALHRGARPLKLSNKR